MSMATDKEKLEAAWNLYLDMFDLGKDEPKTPDQIFDFAFAWGRRERDEALPEVMVSVSVALDLALTPEEIRAHEYPFDLVVNRIRALMVDGLYRRRAEADGE